MLASLTLDVITTFVCNTGKRNHQMNTFNVVYTKEFCNPPLLRLMRRGIHRKVPSEGTQQSPAFPLFLTTVSTVNLKS
eukprot:COSAG02_NODE_20042_length_850_cov_33.500666_1_plen_78_part_00